MTSIISSQAGKNVTINEKLFCPGVLDYIKSIIQNEGAKILLLFEKLEERAKRALEEIKKITKTITFIPMKDRNRLDDDFAIELFVLPNGTINFA